MVQVVKKNNYLKSAAISSFSTGMSYNLVVSHYSCADFIRIFWWLHVRYSNPIGLGKLDQVALFGDFFFRTWLGFILPP